MRNTKYTVQTDHAIARLNRDLEAIVTDQGTTTNEKAEIIRTLGSRAYMRIFDDKPVADIEVHEEHLDEPLPVLLSTREWMHVLKLWSKWREQLVKDKLLDWAGAVTDLYNKIVTQINAQKPGHPPER